MTPEINVPEHRVPSSNQPLRISKTAISLVLAVFLLMGLLTFSAIENINRARTMMEDFLAQKGETIIRSIEAGTRTMIHHMGQGDPLETLLRENSLEDDIAFIQITNSQGVVLMETGGNGNFQPSLHKIALIMEENSPQVILNQENGLFILSRKFQLKRPSFMMPMMMQNQWWQERFHWDKMIISVGLLTTKFDQARKQDVQHTLFMGAILFLVGSAGFYFLFLYQGMRVVRSTLANMKLYTDNVIESIPAGLVTLDADEKIVSCNKKAEEILGSTEASVQGVSLKVAFPGCTFDCAQICRELLEHAATCVTADGRKIPVKISGSSLLDLNGQNIGTVLIIRDMSLLHELELQLERSRRMAALGKMAAGIAHEIRNPLGTLRGFAQYFGKKAGNDRDSKGYADLMVSEVDRLNENISGLLQFARPREPKRIAVRVCELIKKTVALMEADFKSREINFNWKCDESVCLEIDPDLILQVLLNLLKNSIHATDVGGKISVVVRQQAGVVIFSVKDSGVGMTEQEREKMFDPFFTTKNTGTGLGLAVSHRIVEQHNGSFEVLTEPYRGTEISIILPNIHENVFTTNDESCELCKQPVYVSTFI